MELTSGVAGAQPALLSTVPGAVRPLCTQCGVQLAAQQQLRAQSAAAAAAGMLAGGTGAMISQRAHLVKLLEEAATASSTAHFQMMLNRWLCAESGCISSAFLIFRHEHGRAECKVVNELALEETIDFGESDRLSRYFSYSDEVPAHRLINSGDEDLCSAMSILLSRLRCSAACATAAGQPQAASTSASGDDDNNAAAPADGDATLLPIHSQADGQIAVLCVLHRSEQSAHDEVSWLKPELRLIAALFGILLNIEEQRRLARQSQVFLSMAQNVFSNLQDMSLLVRNITKEAKTLVQAETCSLFLLDKEHGELVAEVFEKNGLSDHYLTEIRLPLTEGIAGQVATSGRMMNVKDAYSHPAFFRTVDERTGFFTRNILCLPIKDAAGEVVGVAELCNKIGRSHFTRHDEQVAAAFSVYCAISISHCLLYRRLRDAQRRQHVASEMLVPNSSVQLAEEDIIRLTVRPLRPPNELAADFDRLHFTPRTAFKHRSDEQLEASMTLFQSLGFLSRYRIRRRTLARFLLMVQKGYRDVPYHTWTHAFSVAHFAYLIMRMPEVQGSNRVVSDLEKLSFLVAAFCHDIDHRGTTNAFQLQSKTPLAQLYSSEGSVLERHHFAQTVCILNMEDCNIFDNLSAEQYHTVLDKMRSMILATDIASHFKRVDRLKAMVAGGFNRSQTGSADLLLALMINAADLSDQSKDWCRSKRVAAKIYAEFFSQGDLEKAMGRAPGLMMDRNRAQVPKLQIEFFDTVALPIFSFISSVLPSLSPTYEQMLTNRKCWQIMNDLLQSGNFQLGSRSNDEQRSASQLDILYNVDLERRVLVLAGLANENDFDNANEVKEADGEEEDADQDVQMQDASVGGAPWQQGNCTGCDRRRSREHSLCCSVSPQPLAANARDRCNTVHTQTQLHLPAHAPVDVHALTSVLGNVRSISLPTPPVAELFRRSAPEIRAVLMSRYR